jgi:hypothetical protein
MADPKQLAEQLKALSPQERADLVNDLTNEQVIELIEARHNCDAVLTLMNRTRNPVMIELINSHNPYTSNDPNDMSVFVGNPDPSVGNPDPKKAAANNIRQIELEVDGPYTMAMEWNFKGSPQKINKALRLKYRYRARNLDLPNRPLLEPDHLVTAYLLIGFEDGGF